MTWINYDDVVGQLREAGLLVKDAEVGIRKRVTVSGLTQKGWYALHEIHLDDGRLALIGAYGWWIGAEKFVKSVKLRVGGKAVKLTDAQSDAMKKRIADEKRRTDAECKARAERAAVEAGKVWRAYSPEGHCDYLERKNVRAHGVRFAPSGASTMAVPMMDSVGKIWGIQIIRGKDRGGKLEKQNWPKGLLLKGHYHLIGGIPRDVVLIAEGYATAATLHQATGIPVVVAFFAGNLTPVAEAIRKAYCGTRILVAADDDYLTEGNPGVAAAEAAALAVGGAAVVPVFADRGNRKLTDFNDLAAIEGEPIVRAQIEAKLVALEWHEKKDFPVRAASSSQGSGESARSDGRERARSVMSVEEIVERFVPLDDGTGKAVFDTWTRKPVSRDQMFAILPAGAKSDDIKRHPVWIERGAAYLDEVGFDPTEKDPAVRLNTWRGWPLVPKEGKCERLLELLQYLCNVEDGGEEVYQWLLKWMAYPLQHPGAKMASAVIMHGPQGTGKSTVFQTLARIYGDYATVLNQRGLEDRFNADWIDSKLFILAEEVVARAELWHVRDELKELVTGEWIRVNPKFQGAYRQRNQVNIVYLSNHGQPLPLENDDRRHLVVWTPPMLGEDYYDEVFLELEQGGTEAFYWYLLHEVDTSRFHPKKRPPMTDAKRALIHISLPSEQRFAEEWLSGDTPWPVCPCRAGDFYTAYTRWCRINGEARPRPSNQFLGSIARLPGWSKAKKRIHAPSGLVLCPIVIPPEPAMQAAGTAHGPGQAQTDWLTTAVERFADSLKDPAWSGV